MYGSQPVSETPSAGIRLPDAIVQASAIHLHVGDGEQWKHPVLLSEHTISVLTDKERGVLTQVGRGLDNDEIAAELFCSVETVKSHLRAIRQKVGESDRVRLALTAIRAGI